MGKVIARNLTNRTVECHLPGGRSLRLQPGETLALKEADRAAAAIRKLRHEQVLELLDSAREIRASTREAIQTPAPPTEVAMAVSQPMEVAAPAQDAPRDSRPSGRGRNSSRRGSEIAKEERMDNDEKPRQALADEAAAGTEVANAARGSAGAGRPAPTQEPDDQ
jgi:hypothetical protein